jgi:endo-1,4-beta-xylanase
MRFQNLLTPRRSPREYNMLEPENAMKWEVIHPAPDKFDFPQAERMVDFASAHGMRVRGHTLMWHRQNPAWLSEGHFTSVELSRILHDQIDAVVGQYRGNAFASE